AFVGVVEFARHSVEAFTELGREARSLSALSGLAADEVMALSHTFTVLGFDSGVLETALFRLGREIDDGGKNLEKFGVTTRKASRELKEPGELFLEVRDRISQMTDASARASAMNDLFGRSAKVMAPIFAMNAAEFRNFGKAVEDLAPWTPERQKLAEQHIEQMGRLRLAYEGLKTAVSEFVLNEGNSWLTWLRESVKDAREFLA